MLMKRIVFFSNHSRIGKTTMVYHTAYMMAELGKKVLVADLDPQANLSSMFLTQERLEEVFLIEDNKLTVTDAIQPIMDADLPVDVHIETINNNISLLIGNLLLSAYEDNLSDAWSKCTPDSTSTYPFKVTTVFYKFNKM